MGGSFSDLSPNNNITGATDSTAIGNVSDSLKCNITNDVFSPVAVELTREHKDSFHNIMTASPYTIWEGDLRFSKKQYYWDESITGAGASSTHVPEHISVKMTVGTVSGEKVIRQTYRNFHYIKGNSQRIMLTGNFSGGKANVRKRYGLFNSYNGMFFELNGTTMNVVVRSDVSGSIVDTAVASSSWNIDTLDGTGPSGVTADPTKQQLFIIDFAFLGVGPIRFSIVVGEEVIPVHVVLSSNIIATSWARSADLPVRCEIENTGTSASASDFYQTCATVKSIGGQLTEGNVKCVDTGTTAVSLTTTPVVAAAIRLNSTAVRGASVKPLDFNLITASGTVVIYYQVILRPTLTGGTWAAFSDVVDVATAAPTYTASTGVVLDSGYMDLGTGSGSHITNGGSSISIGSDKLMGYSIAGTGDALILLVRTISSSGSIYFSGKFTEYT